MRRRHRTKTPPCAADLAAFQVFAGRSTLLSEALAAEGFEDQPLLAPTVKRKHVHWTHVRTFGNWVQPSQMTREEFWLHLEKCYKEAYPRNNSETGSILGFGKIAEEMHAKSQRATERDRHKHGAVFCTEQHYWSKVAKISRDKYRVPLNAVAHDSYAEMYSYVTEHSKKKPLHELDAEPFLSPGHPRGEELQALLLASTNSCKLLKGRDGNSEMSSKKRERPPDIFELIQNKKFKSVLALEAHAASEASAGRTALAAFCTRQGPKLEMLVQKAWDVMGAPERLRLSSMSLMDKLTHAAASLPCCCQGRWAQGAQDILTNNGHDPAEFCASVRRALQVGARRGVNVACFGEGGCGKSSLLEPLEKIFDALPKPQKGSPFAFTGMADCDILLWQDYEHHEDTIRFTDLLSVLCGEAFGIRVPCCPNKKCLNVAPAFYSGRTPIRSQHKDPAARETLNGMMDERFKQYQFLVPLPKCLRQPDWPICGRCAATFYLHGPCGAAGKSSQAACGAVVPARPIAAGVADVVSSLAKLTEMKTAGHLTAEEFQAAKQLVLRP